MRRIENPFETLLVWFADAVESMVLLGKVQLCEDFGSKLGFLFGAYQGIHILGEILNVLLVFGFPVVVANCVECFLLPLLLMVILRVLYANEVDVLF